MILKGNQRGNGADLAIHLVNSFDNESIEVAQVYGAVADDLLGAFAEFEAVSLGTRAREYLYSLSISPPSPLTRAQYFEAIGMIEERLGLAGQPRAVVFHVKPDERGISREHCHVVWSRTDIEKMRAVHMAHDRRKLMDMAVALSHKFGLKMPPGLKAWEDKQKHEKEKLEVTLAEKAQAEATGITPEQRRAEITAAYEQSDTAEAFSAALEQKGYVLARGDKRGFVVVDKSGDVHSLARYIKGHKASAIKDRLAALRPEQLPGVDEAKEQVRQRAQALDERQREQRQEQEREQERQSARQRLEELRRQAEAKLTRNQTARRLELQQAAQEMLTRQQAERLALHAAQKTESRGILFRVRSAVADLIARTPGLRSVLSHIQKMTHLDPKERHRLEDDALSRRHARERLEIGRMRRMHARLDTRERASLEKAMRKAARLHEAARLEIERTAEQARSVENMAMQDFYEAARDQGLWKEREFKEGELRESFNMAAEFTEGANESGGEDEGYAPDWKDDADDDGDDDGPRFRRRRGKGFGYRRDSD
ncbi:relaxase/mobilization nuclease domain-containing protein [Sinorhizobium meliloti]|uniref:relaxase/mobilization nuclease domain-containing protein n=1 Tax=Rhizobium meliloti TaxID=382 RepID=UPI00299E7CE8